jgi:hypothetical protein
VSKSLKDIYDELEKVEPSPKTPSVDLDPADIEFNREQAKYNMFDEPYDHVSFGNTAYNDQFSKIKVLDHGLNQYKTSLGRRCMPFDWVAVHWTSKMDNMGHPKQVENSYQTRGEADPMVYQLGHYYSMKCWEMAAVNMHAGEQF